MGYDKKLFAAKLRGARAELGMTQDEFAAAIGVSKSTLCDYETGNGYVPGVDKMVAISELTGKQPNELLGWKPQPEPTAATPSGL